MITYIHGELTYKSENGIIIEANDIGYYIIVSEATLYKLPDCGNRIKIYTYLQPKDDGLFLYGFLTFEELNLYKKLITVSGIGPKGALGILAIMSPNELYTAIVSEDVKTISKAPGIGKKTAGRLILDLKDKIRLEDELSFKGSKADGENMVLGESPVDMDEAIEALVSLGYSKSQAYQAVSSVNKDSNKVEDVIKEALKKLSAL